MSGDLSEVFRTERAAHKALREYVESGLWRQITGRPLFRVLLDRVEAAMILDDAWRQSWLQLHEHYKKTFVEKKK